MPPTQIPGLRAVADRYDAILCDVWGVLHNGVAARPGVLEALNAFRAGGRPVILVTNAPRPSDGVAHQLGTLDIRDGWDGIVSSGDVVQRWLAESGYRTAYHIGADRDLPLYEETGLTLVGADAAPDVIVIAGLRDDLTETPDDYRDELETLVATGVPAVCANPDLVVTRGDRLLYCAGALAEMMEGLGHPVMQFGKPYPPIYAAARAAIAALAPDARRILVIGDGLPTDIAGAASEGLDALFVTDGIHAADFGPADAPDPAEVAARLAAEGFAVPYFIPRLVW